MVRDVSSKLVKILVDGVVVGTAAYTTNGPEDGSNSSLIIGANGAGSTIGTNKMNGQLSDLRVWNVVRSDEQIADNMDNVLSGNQSGSLVANYQFNDGTGSTAIDSSGTSGNVTITGTAAWIDTAPDINGKAVTILEHTSLQGEMSAAGADGAASSYGVTTSAGGTATIDSNGHWTYNPASNYHGSETLTFTATGAQGTTDTETITVTITADASTTSPTSNSGVLKTDGVNDVFLATGAAQRATNASFTVESWINLAELPADTEVAISNLTTGNKGWEWQVGTSGALSFGSSYDGTNDNSNIDPNIKLDVGAWTHVAMSYDAAAKTLKFYQDGNLTNTVDMSANGTFQIFGSTAPLAIGARSADGTATGITRPVDASFDEVRIWSDVRTQAEIQDNYDQHVAGNAQGLVNYWAFDGSGATTVTDQGSGANNGTLYNGAGVQNLPLHAVSMDGSADRVNLGAIGNLATGTGSFTHEIWFKTGGNGGTREDLISIGNTTTTNQSMTLYIDSDGQLKYGQGFDAASIFSSNISVIDNEWHHASITYNAATGLKTLYLDGNAVATSTHTGPNLINGVAYIGDAVQTGYSFNGQLADARFWNVARSVAQIADNYDNTLTGTQSGTLIASYPLNESSGTTANDATGTHDGTLVGNAVFFDAIPEIHTTSVAVLENHTAVGVMTTTDVVPTSATFGVSATNAASNASSLSIAGKGVVNIDTATGNWTFTPIDKFHGTAQFYLSASGGTLSDVEQFTVTVQSVDVDSVNASRSMMQFDGVDDQLTTTATGMQTGTGSFTMETWFNTTDQTAILLDLGREVTDGALRLFLSGGVLSVAEPGVVITQATGVTVTDGNWHHSAVVYNGASDTLSLYVDGALVKSATGVTLNIPAGEISLGDYNPSTGNSTPYQGQLADVRMWSTARTGSEIIENYNQKLSGTETGLQAYYTFEDRDGSTVNDVTSNNNDLKVTSEAVTLNGTNQGFTAANSSSLNFGTTGSFTLESWFKTSASPGDYQRILFKNADSLDGGQQYSIDIDPNGYAEIRFNNNTSGNTALKTDIKVNDGTWHHMASVFDNANDKLYIYLDGQLNNTLSTTEIPKQDTGSLGIGYAINEGGSTPGQYFNGQLDDVRIWNTARTAAEIAANYQTTFSDNQSGALVSQYTFESLNGNSSTGLNNASALNAPTFSAVARPTSNGPTASDSGGPDIFGNAVSIIEDQTAAGTMTASDLTGTASYSVNTAATNGTVAINATTGAWTYTPNSNYSGSDAFKLQAADGTFTDIETISITVKADHDPNIATSVLQLSGGSTDFATVAHNNALNATAAGFTVELWLNGSGGGAHAGILDKMNQPNGSVFNGWKLNLDASGTKPIFYIGDNDAYLAVGSTSTVVDSAWHHVAAVYDGTANTIQIYVDGTTTGAAVSTTSLTASQFANSINLLIGDDNYATNPNYKGMMDDIRIWSDARTAEEISSNMHKQLSGSESNLVAYYPMDSTDGVTLTDKAGGDNPATLQTSSGINIVNLPTSAINLDGTNDYVQIANNADLNPTNWTVEALFNTTTAHGGGSAYGQIVSKSVSGQLQYAIGMSNGKLSLFTNDSTNAVYLETTGTYNDGNWHHVSGVYDGTNLNLYVDGQLVVTQAFSGTVATSSNPLTIGAREETGNAPWQYFTGKIADVRLWNDARTADEINANYDHALIGNESGLVLNYQFHGLDGTSVIDNSPNHITGTAVGGLTIIDPRPDIEGNAVSVSNDDTVSGTMTAADVAGTPLFTIVSQPSHGTISLDSENGDWTYTPTKGYVGSDSFAVKATGATSGTDTETISLTVTAASDARSIPTQSALQFDGVDDYVIIGNLSQNIFGAYTMEAWVYYDPSAFTDNNWMRIVELGNGPDSNNLLLAIDPGSDVFSFDTRNGATASNVKADTTTATGQWIHVAGVNDGAGNGFLYVNGELVKTTTGQQVAQDVVRTQNYIGQSNWANESNMHGSIADVRIWNDARTTDEIKDSYNKVLTGSEDNLVAYYTFDDTATGVVRDMTGHGNDGQIITTGTAGTNGNGPTGNVLKLDGTGDFVSISHDASLNTTTWTLEAWFNTTSHGSSDPLQAGRIVSKGVDATFNGYSLVVTGGKLSTATNGLTTNGLTSTSSVNDGVWHHAAWTYDGTSMNLYIDGVLEQTVSGITGTPTLNSNDLTIGAYQEGANSPLQYFNGSIDNVRVWDSARTADQVHEGMSNSYDYDTSGLLTQYTFDDVNGTTVGDTGKANGAQNGTLNGDAKVVDSGSGGGIATHIDNAIRFDGSGDTVDMGAVIGPVGTNDRTIMLWAKSSGTANGYLFSEGAAANGEALGLSFNSYGAQGPAILVDTGFSAVSYQPLTNPVDGQWHHYAVVVPDGGTTKDIRIYQDGMLLTTVVSSLNPTYAVNTNAASQNFMLGQWVTNSAFFNGDLAQVQVWDSALTTAQLQHYMDNPPAGSTSGLSGYWSGANDGSGKVMDYTSGNHDGTLGGNASIIDTAPDITSNSVHISEDTIATGQIISNGVNSMATYGVQAAAAHGTVTIDSTTGVWNYIPTSGYSGSDTFTLQANGDVSTAHEVISVNVGVNPTLPTNHAIVLDGTDDYVDLGTFTSEVTGAYTVEAWINPDTYVNDGKNGWMRIFDVGDGTGGGDNNGFLLTLEGTTGKLALYTYSGGNSSNVTSTASVVPLDAWTHVAAVNDGAGTAQLYVNGALIASTSSGAQFAAPNGTTLPNAYIGKSNNTADSAFDGSITEARIWNDARTASEIADSYDKQLNGNEQGLAGYWSFNEGAGNVASDQSGNGHDASVIGGTHENLNSISMAAGASYKGLILGADADGNDSLSYSVSTAANGTLALDSDGSFSYTNSTNADDSFNVTITDSDGHQIVETIHIDVP